MSFFRRLGRLFRGFLGLFIGGIEKQNPKALLESHIQEFDKNQATFNRNLAQQDALRRRLLMQVNKEKAQEEQLVVRAKALLQAGRNDLAGQLAAQRKTLLATIQENQRQLEAAEQQYQTLSKQRDAFVKTARTRIQSIRGKISQAEMAAAQAKLTEMASNLTFNPDGQGLSDLESTLDEQITEAQGRSRVAQDASANDAWQVSEIESEIQEQGALADFAKEFGLENQMTVDAEIIEPKALAAPSAQIEVDLSTSTIKDTVPR